jgi:peptide/nickel transport system substrate-binding protein
MTMLRATLLALALVWTFGAHAQTMRIALAGDPDALDPTMGRSLYGRIVFAALCDKLFDTDANLNIVPQLAAGHEWSADNKTLTIRLRDGVVFHDGERMDAEAVRISLDRHLNMPGSQRRSEISVVQSMEVVDRLTLRLSLSVPFAPLLAQFTDRAGMILSPRAIRELGANFATRPACAGPFRFVERVAQDRIVLDRFPEYWDRARIHLDRVVYLSIRDTTVRLANLQSGGIELVETLATSDVAAVRRNPRLRLEATGSLGFRGIQINHGNGEAARNSPLSNPKVLEAFDLSIDRTVLNQVAYDGVHIASAQFAPPDTPFHVADIRMPGRDLARARALLREAGVTNPTFRLMVQNSPDWLQAAEVIQAMAREAGFDMRIQATEFATALTASQQGQFDAFMSGWSGRPDPDGNIYAFIRSGGTNNDGRYANPEVDRLLDGARATNDAAERRRLYRRVTEIIGAERPWIFLYHVTNLHALSARVQGFRAHPDALIRLQDVRLAAN